MRKDIFKELIILSIRQMPKVGGKRKKTKTHEEVEDLSSGIPRCKYSY